MLRTHKQHGLTLFELLFGLAIVSILLCSALPNWQEIITRNHEQAAQWQLAKAIQYAKEAVIYNHVPITLCKTIDQKTCSNSAIAQYLIFINDEQNANADAPRQILKILPTYDTQTKVIWKMFADTKVNQPIKFLPTQTYFDNGSFVVCTRAKRLSIIHGLIMNVLGRVRMVTIDHKQKNSDPSLLSLMNLYSFCLSTG